MDFFNDIFKSKSLKNLDSHFNKMFKDIIDVDAINRFVESTGDKVFDTFLTVKNQISKFKDDKFIVEQHYNRDTEKLSFSLNTESRELSINTTAIDGRGASSSTHYIDTCVDIDSMKQKYDAENKKMIFTFNLNDNVNMNLLKEKLNTQVKSIFDKIQNGIKGETTDGMIERVNHILHTIDDALKPVETASTDTTEEEFVEETEFNEDNDEERTLSDNAKMAALHEGGMSYREIGRRFGISDKTVKRRIHTYITSQEG